MAVRTLRIVVLVIVAFAAGLLLARLIAPSRVEPPQTERATVFPAARPVPTLDLVDQDGKALGPDFFKGHWTLVFFGFTQCPDVCPTTLATLARTVRELDDLPAVQRPRVLLVSLDPERDTPDILAPYVRFFDPSFLGARGSLEATAAAASAFNLPYARVALPEGGYTLDHGSGIFIVGPSGGTEAYLSAPHEAATIARDYRTIVAWAGARK
jgi:protein SCO1